MGSVTINEASIQAKVAAWSRSSAGQAKIGRVISDYIATGRSACVITGDVVTKAQMMEAANKMKSILQQFATGLPASVQAHVAGVSIGPLVENGPGSYSISLDFSGDMARPSLQPSVYGGVDNIVALFNNGYRAGGKVYGMWHGHPTGSLQERVGTHFVTQAVAAFNSTCGGQYHAVATASGQYA